MLLKISLLSTMRDYKKEYLPKDIFSGFIIAALSIPISMGYAQIAGLPAVYGLYGSVFPILVFALFSTSPQFIFGVDAAPAALVGGILASLNIASGSAEAIAAVPVITFFTACWLLLFYLLKAGKLVGYISNPVMGGFISGICCEIILMQTPKLLGAGAGTGELFELIEKIVIAARGTNLLSPLLGFGTLVIMLICKKYIPKLPMPIVMMGAGALITVFFHPERYGVALLSAVEPGLPALSFPDLSAMELSESLSGSLTIAIVIMAETLLAENSVALRNGYKINDNREILAFSLGNFFAAVTGCCPINGSVSRSSVNESTGGKTQLTSIVAGVLMIFVLLFATGFIAYLPVPVLTAIVIFSLMGVVEVHLAKRLFKADRNEFFIFIAAFLGVLTLGTIHGVVLGLLLSFIAVIERAMDPPRTFIGRIPGHDGFYSMDRNHMARSIEGVVIYRFSGNLFFANINSFQQDIEQSIEKDTKCIIVDGAGITDIDITAADRIDILYKNLAKKGIKFFITGHIESVNDRLRKCGLGHLISDGVVRRTIETALNCVGLRKPYPLSNKYHAAVEDRDNRIMNELVWAFGPDAEKELEKQTQYLLTSIAQNKEEEIRSDNQLWNTLTAYDEDSLLGHLELHFNEMAELLGKDEISIIKNMEFRRYKIARQLYYDSPESFKHFAEYHRETEKALFDKNPEIKEKILLYRKQLVEQIEQHDKNVAATIRKWYSFED